MSRVESFRNAVQANLSKTAATLDKGPRTFVPEQLKAQLAFWDVAAISGGRIETHGNGFRLPVAYGYAVDIFLEADDTYTVQTVFTRSGVTKVVNSSEGVYADEVSQAAYQASLFRDKPWEKGGRKTAALDDIVAYTYNADIYCPEHILDVMGQPDVGDVEGALDNLAAERGIDRYAEETFDSGEFPKVVFRDQAQGEHCGMGHEIEASLRRHALSDLWRWEEWDVWGEPKADSGMWSAVDKKTGQEVASVELDTNGSWLWQVHGPPGQVNIDDGYAATAEEAKKAAEFVGIPFPGQQSIPFDRAARLARHITGLSKSDICPNCGAWMDNVFISAEGVLRAVCDNCGWRGTKRMSSKTAQDQARVQIRQKNYQEQDGWLIVGTDTYGRRVDVFVPGDRTKAEAVKTNIMEGKDAFEGYTAKRRVAYDPEMAQLGDMFRHQFEDMEGKERADTLPCPDHKDKEATKGGTYASFPSSYTEYHCPEGHDFKVRVGTTREDILAEGKKMAYGPYPGDIPTPWGYSQEIRQSTTHPGVIQVYTAGHGGVFVPDAQIGPIPTKYRDQAFHERGGYWFEEDVAANIPIKYLPGLLEEWYPNYSMAQVDEAIRYWIDEYDNKIGKKGARGPHSELIFTDWFGEIPRGLWYLLRRSNVSPSDFTELTDEFGLDFDAITKAIKDRTEDGMYRPPWPGFMGSKKTADVYNDPIPVVESTCPTCHLPVQVWSDNSEGITVNFACDNPDCPAGKGPWDTSRPTASKKTGFLTALQRGVRRVLALDPQSGYGDSSLDTVEEDTPDDKPMWPWEIGEVVEEVVEEVKEGSLKNVWAYNGFDPSEACEICGQPLAKVGGSYQHLSGMADIDHRATPRFARVALEDTNTDDTMWEVELEDGEPDSGEDAADVGDVHTPGQEVADYPQPDDLEWTHGPGGISQSHAPHEGAWSDDDAAFNMGISSGPYYPPSRMWKDQDAGSCQICGGAADDPVHQETAAGGIDHEFVSEQEEGPRFGSHTALTLDSDRVPDDTDPAFGWELPTDPSADPDLGQGAADVADVPTPGDALEGSYPQPSVNTQLDDSIDVEDDDEQIKEGSRRHGFTPSHHLMMPGPGGVLRYVECSPLSGIGDGEFVTCLLEDGSQVKAYAGHLSPIYATKDAARSDYEHWNEEADAVWWAEEGSQPESEPDPDEFYDEDESDEEDIGADRDSYYASHQAGYGGNWYVYDSDKNISDGPYSTRAEAESNAEEGETAAMGDEFGNYVGDEFGKSPEDYVQGNLHRVGEWYDELGDGDDDSDEKKDDEEASEGSGDGDDDSSDDSGDGDPVEESESAPEGEKEEESSAEDTGEEADEADEDEDDDKKKEAFRQTVQANLRGMR